MIPARFVRSAFLPPKILEELRDVLGDRLLEAELRGPEDGGAARTIWCSLAAADLMALVEALARFDFPHFHVLSGDDVGDRIRLIYHFSLFLAVPEGRVGVACSVDLPKDNPEVISLGDLIPGVEYSEREMEEMLGVRFRGSAWAGRIFLPEDWDGSVHPWRRDEAGLGPEHLRDLE